MASPTSSLGRLVGRMRYSTPTEDQQALLDTPTAPVFKKPLPLSPPPSGSLTIEELRTLSLLAERDRDAHAAFIKAADGDLLSLFTDLAMSLGIPFDRDEIKAIMDDAAVVITKLKFHFNRARPYQVASLLDYPFLPMGTSSGHSPAYPSGHTIQSRLLAHHFAALDPEHQDTFFDLAAHVSWSRVLGGYHWPSDLAYGEVIADALAERKPSSIIVAAKT
jgi:hypothetical protein